MKKTPRLLVLAPFALLAALAACGGGSDDSGALPGQLTDPETVPTATPWDESPEVVVLDPENIQPLPPTQPEGDSTATPVAGEPGTCGETYIVVAGDTTSAIAERCGVSTDDIATANPDIDIRSLSIGQEIILPTASEE